MHYYQYANVSNKYLWVSKIWYLFPHFLDTCKIVLSLRNKLDPHTRRQCGDWFRNYSQGVISSNFKEYGTFISNLWNIKSTEEVWYLQTLEIWVVYFWGRFSVWQARNTAFQILGMVVFHLSQATSPTPHLLQWIHNLFSWNKSTIWQ